ncbi:ABC transporter permease, partial [Mesorhizobium sp. M7A.F.Ca.US.011.01.1.1]
MEAHVDNAGKSPDTGAGRRDHLSVLLWLLQAGPIIILVTLVVAFGLLAPHFISVRNLQNLLAQSAIVCALGLGQFLVILVRGVDVSVGSVIA